MFRLTSDPQAPARILCLGAHADDIEIGCGGTLLRLIASHSALEVTWIVFSANGQRAQEAYTSAERFLQGVSSRNVIVRHFRDGFFPYTGAEIKEFFEQLKQDYRPDLVFTHYRDDRHQDHRQLSDLAWNTFRSHLILEYEIPKFDGDMGIPNLFVPLSQEIAQRKVEYLMQAFPSQQGRHWFTEDTFLGMMRLRGIECNEQTHYAEAFHCRKLAFL